MDPNVGVSDPESSLAWQVARALEQKGFELASCQVAVAQIFIGPYKFDNCRLFVGFVCYPWH